MKIVLFVPFIVLFLFLPVSSLVLPGYQRMPMENLLLFKYGAFSENPEEISGQFEGDILLSEDQANFINYVENPSAQNFNGKINAQWENKTVPYKFDDNTFSEEQIQYILDQWTIIEKYTCIRFVPRTNEKDYVLITGNAGCYSNVGRKGGMQTINWFPQKIGTNCFRNGVIFHETIHTLGFFHMQSSNNRDDYITVYFDNIKPGMEKNFIVIDKNLEINFGYEYDLLSVMHYSRHAFAKRIGLTTIEPHDPSFKEMMGQRHAMTKTDIGKINKMYNC